VAKVRKNLPSSAFKYKVNSPMPDAFSHIRKLTDAVHPLNEGEWEAFQKIWTPVTAKRKEWLTIAGEKEKYLYFVLEGVQRVVYFDETDREATLVFTYAPSFGGVLDSLMMQQPSRYFYETLTPSGFLRAPFIELQRLMETYPNIEYMIRKGITGAMSGLLERIVELQCFSSEEKFRKLLQRSPHILQLVPHKYLANYLGIDATNFSKLINTIRI
jgi:CRP-like cAMP-binding protein